MSIILNKKNNIAEIILNNPKKHNAFDELFIQDFIAILDQISQDQDLRIVIIKSSSKNFCAGADLKWMARMKDFSYEENIADAMQLGLMLEKLNTLPIPTIAIAQGATYGGGLGILACCDIVIADQNSKFCFSETKLGLIPAMISPYIKSAIGERNMRRLFLTAEVFDANKALTINLVSEISDQNNFEQISATIINNILNTAPGAIEKAKKLILGNNNQLENAKILSGVRVSAEAQDFIDAFLSSN